MNDFSGVGGQVIQARDIGSVTFAAHVPEPVVPAQAPAPPEGFVDRADERAMLRELAAATDASRDRPVVAVLDGMRGVGKTALLRKAAAELSGGFPDGVPHVVFGLDGQSPSGAAGGLLQALGVPAERIPSDFAGRVAQLRSLTARQALLMLFDDVTEAAQVTALLPSSGAALVLAAANTSLEELYVDGATRMPLTPLRPEHAVALLRWVCPDERLARAPEDCEVLAELCGNLPLALRTVATRLTARPHWTVRRLVEELRTTPDEGATRRSGVLDKVDRVFDTVYAGLPGHLREVYRTLGLMVGGRFSVEVLAAMSDRRVLDVSHDLEELVDQTAMVEARPDGTFGLHRLVRRHALRVSLNEDSEAERADRLSRAVDWWLLGATAADVASTGPQRLRIADPERLLGAGVVDLDKRAARDWLHRERDNIVAAMEAAAAQGWHDRAWRLFEAFFAYLDARRPLALWVRAATLAVRSAELDGDRAAEARCRCLLGKAYQELERYREAEAELERARAIASECDELLLASTYDFTGNLSLRQGQPADALEWFRKALDINIRRGTGRGTAMQTWFVGRAQGALNRVDEALASFADAVRLANAAEAANLEPRILLDAAAVSTGAGRYDEAGRVLAEAHALAVELELTAIQADVAKARATLADKLGDAESAHDYRSQAAEAYASMGNPRAARLLAGFTEHDPA
ncbi:tetratricopeptide repeat protein [Prauserella marina]|uniref:tetratricopeptide repeat protein n=1 Tax=Prauserella marina TaxID=530584 RepID=UPI001FE907C1|nr:tetratricopeptide repeat protein [Prauserella marina]